MLRGGRGGVKPTNTITEQTGRRTSRRPTIFSPCAPSCRSRATIARVLADHGETNRARRDNGIGPT